VRNATVVSTAICLLHPATTVFVVVATGNRYGADNIVALTMVATVISAQAVHPAPWP
jgi:hypothetical protein